MQTLEIPYIFFLQAYHLCTRHGGGMTFQCPEKTVFQQRTMVCNHEHMVNCSLSEKYYDTNLRIGQHVNLIDDGNSIIKMILN